MSGKNMAVSGFLPPPSPSLLPPGQTNNHCLSVIWSFACRAQCLSVWHQTDMCLTNIFCLWSPGQASTQCLVDIAIFACQAQCLSIWPPHKHVLDKQFLLDASKEYFWNWQAKYACQAMFVVVAKRTSMLDKQIFKCLQTLFVRLGGTSDFPNFTDEAVIFV